MSARGLLALLALTLGACGAHKPRLTTEGWAWVPLHPLTREPALAALVLEHGMPLPGESESEEHPLAAAVWADGTLVWCAAGGGGYGHPYYTATLAPDAVEKLRTRLVEIMLERDGKRGSFEIFDTSHEVMVVRQGDRAWRMRSCIDLFEEDPKLVAFARGIAPRDQMPATSADDPEELDLRGFRAAWASAKQLLLSAVPNTGTDAGPHGFEYARIGAKRE